MTTALFMLRAAQVGISIADLELLSVGMVCDIFTERTNDDAEYDYLPTQEDIDRL